MTADGRCVRVLVNAATPAEISAGLAAGADGAGLIRTELAFLDAPRWPSREQHASMLTPLLAGLAGRTATVRVLDFGGDKLPPSCAPSRGAASSYSSRTPEPSAPSCRDPQLAGGADAARPAPDGADGRDVSITRAILATLGGELPLGAMIELPEAADGAPRSRPSASS